MRKDQEQPMRVVPDKFHIISLNRSTHSPTIKPTTILNASQ